jgi:tRNA-specific 2-thiouridylase
MKSIKKIKAVGLFSGGLDSILAVKLMQQQAIDVTAVVFRSPFFIDEEKKKKLEKTADEHGFKIHFVNLGKDYLNLVRRPKHGYGKNINPCIDCHAFMIRKAAAYANKIGAHFVFTGEVLDERPMSQNRASLYLVEEEAGLKGKLLRPLSAKLLPETEAEAKGFVDRSLLKGISGRNRKPQIELAKSFGLSEFETPAGGCLLTCEAYAHKLKDLFGNQKEVSFNDIYLLKAGRHFRHGKCKIIVGRSKEDNEQLLKLKDKSDIMLEAKDAVGPTTLIRGKADKKTIELAAQITARYSDSKEDRVAVKYGKVKFDKEIAITKISETVLEQFRIK